MRVRLFPWFALLTLAIAPSAALAGENSVSPRLPSRAEAQAVCGMIAARGAAIKAMLVKDGVLDANNDGVPDSVTVGVGMGTMRGDWLQFRARGAAKDSDPVEATTQGYEGKDYMPFGARWLPYAGRVYTLYFEAEDLRRASYLAFIDPRNVEHLLCDFSNIERETLRPVGARDANGLCHAVAQGNVTYTPIAEASDADVGIETGRSETHITGRISADFANTGTPTQIVRLAYASGAGRGCDFDYFDLITDDRVVSSGDAHATLMKLQGLALDPDFTNSRCDGVAARWLSYRGRTFLDIATTRYSIPRAPLHDVRVVRDKRIATLCRGEFSLRWKVQSMGPEFR